jgi:hypothetical protein
MLLGRRPPRIRWVAQNFPPPLTSHVPLLPADRPIPTPPHTPLRPSTTHSSPRHRTCSSDTPKLLQAQSTTEPHPPTTALPQTVRFPTRSFPRHNRDLTAPPNHRYQHKPARPRRRNAKNTSAPLEMSARREAETQGKRTDRGRAMDREGETHTEGEEVATTTTLRATRSGFVNHPHESTKEEPRDRTCSVFEPRARPPGRMNQPAPSASTPTLAPALHEGRPGLLSSLFLLFPAASLPRPAEMAWRRARVRTRGTKHHRARPHRP